ncbi:MAG: hypothetical protein KC502_06000 [Myxococcales bacterium]|nr:hypothetical protein [Myxococcales bacterium]
MSRRTKRTGFGIIGAGRWGITLSHVVASHDNDTFLWCEDAKRAGLLQRKRSLKKAVPELAELHERVKVTADLAEVVSSCHTLIVACTADVMRDWSRRLGTHVDGSHVVLHAVRGLEPATLKRATRVLREETCVRKVGALAGPALVEELLAGRPNAFICASRYPEVVARAREALAGPSVRVYAGKDLAGVEIAAAASAVAAVGMGIALELGLGPATLSILGTRGAAEIARVVSAAGGDPNSAYGLAGLGELLALRESESREVRAGRLFAQGSTPAQVEKKLGRLDAVGAARSFAALAAHYHVQAHIAAAVTALLDGTLDARGAMAQLMTLRQMNE